MTSRIPGFHALSRADRLAKVAEMTGLTNAELDHLTREAEASGDLCDHLAENVVSVMSIPLGVATNVIVDGVDVIAVHEAAVEAVERARQGGGPSMIEAKTYRFYNHHGVQNLGLKYRSDEEVAIWKQRDPIFTFEDRMIENGVATRANFDDIWAELRADIETAIQFAEDSPYPTPDQILVNVYTSMTGAN